MLLYKCGFSNTDNFFSLFLHLLGNQEYSGSQLPTKIEKLEDDQAAKNFLSPFFAFVCTISDIIFTLLKLDIGTIILDTFFLLTLY
jgi:hypothetical protein